MDKSKETYLNDDKNYDISSNDIMIDTFLNGFRFFRLWAQKILILQWGFSFFCINSLATIQKKVDKDKEKDCYGLCTQSLQVWKSDQDGNFTLCDAIFEILLSFRVNIIQSWKGQNFSKNFKLLEFSNNALFTTCFWFFFVVAIFKRFQLISFIFGWKIDIFNFLPVLFNSDFKH